MDAMKIEGPRQTQNVGRTEKSGSASQTGEFSRMLGSGSAGAAGGTSAASATASVGGVFMLQAESEGERKRRRLAIARGQDALGLLDQIATALLSGDVTTDHLNRLKSLAGQQLETVADPKLAAVLDEIEIRLAVETAKLEKAAESAHNL